MTTDVLLAKLGSIQRCLHRIRTVTHGDPSRVHDLDTQEIVVLNLQRAIQAALDLAAHVIAARGWGLPDSLKRHFTMLEQEGAISGDLARRLEAMAGLRNIAVHDYDTLSPDILERIVAERLGDLEEFADAIRRLSA